MGTQTPAPEALPVTKAAARLGVDWRTLKKAVEERQAPGFLVGRNLMIPVRWLDRVLSGEIDPA